MSRILAVCLVLCLASVSYGELIQSWEDGQGNIGSWGPAIVGGQAIGVTDGSMSVGVVAATGWGFIGQVAPDPTAAQFAAHDTIEIDVTVVGADWAGDNGFQFGLVVNSDGGWHQADVGAWYWGGDGADFTEHLVWNYSAYKAAVTTWAQIILFQNSYSNSGMTSAIYYLDNLQLTGTPEPATMALLGLGGLALLRRKK